MYRKKENISSSSSLPFSFKHYCDYIGPTSITQYNLLISRFLTSLITFSKSLFLYKVTYTRVFEIMTWISWGIHYSASGPPSGPKGLHPSLFNACKMHYTHSNIAKCLNTLYYKLKSKISCESHELKSPKCHHLHYLN